MCLISTEFFNMTLLTFGVRSFFVVEAALCIVGCLPSMTETLPIPVVTIKTISSYCTRGTESPPVGNYSN